MKNASRFYKDVMPLNTRSKKGQGREWMQETENLNTLLSNLKTSGFEGRKSFLFPSGEAGSEYKSSGGNRDACEGVLEEKTKRNTEKRICRCLFYSNNGSKNNPCEKCKFKSVFKKTNAGSIMQRCLSP